MDRSSHGGVSGSEAAGRRGHRWSGTESPWFDVFLVGVLVVDVAVEGFLRIVDGIRRVVGDNRQAGVRHRPRAEPLERS